MGDLEAKPVRTYVVRSAGRCLGIVLVSSGLWQGLYRLTDTRGLESLPGRSEGGSEGRSKKSSLSCMGRLSGVSEAAVGPTARIVKIHFS